MQLPKRMKRNVQHFNRTRAYSFRLLDAKFGIEAERTSFLKGLP